MTFEYRDNTTCDKFVAQPDTDDDRKPVVFLSTTGLNNGVYVPLDHVEEVVAGIRDAARTAARQTTGQDDTECVDCEHPKKLHKQNGCNGHWGPEEGCPCPQPVETAPWTADGRHGPTPAEMADRRIPTCYVQFMGGAHCATAPAVGQPAEAQATDKQQPARTDLYDALDQSWYRWGPPGTPKADSLNRLIDAHAAEVRAAALREAADAVGRIPTGDCSDADSRDEAWDWGAQAAADLLRRMAEEARS